MVNNIKALSSSPQSDISPVSTDISDIKVPKLYGSYSKRQQAKVVAFIRKGNSLRSAEKLFGIPKSTLHCWLKKLDSSPKKDSHILTKSPEPFQLKTFLEKENSYSKPNDTYFSDLKNKEEKLLHKKDIYSEEEFIIEFLRTKEGVELIAKAYNISVCDFMFYVSNLKKRVNIKEEENKLLKVIQSQVAQSKYPSDTGNDLDINKNVYECDNYKRAYFYDSDDDSKIFTKKARKVLEEENTSSLVLKNALQVPSRSSNQCHLQCNNRKNNFQTFTSNDIPIYMKPCDEFNLNSLEEGKKEMHLGHSSISCDKEINIKNKSNNLPIYMKPCDELNLHSLEEEEKEMHLGHSAISCEKEINRTNKSNNIPIYMKTCNEVNLHSLEEEKELHLGHSVSCDKEINRKNKSNNIPIYMKPCDESSLHSLEERRELQLGHSTISCDKEINRTDSEKELMALVTGENITADELCKDLNFSDLRNWVDNESWYIDQYLKYFRVCSHSTRVFT